MSKVNFLRDSLSGEKGNRLNVPHETIKRNIRSNIRRPVPQVTRYPGDPKTKVMLLCGGPSMEEMLPEIKRRKRQGWKVAAVNGAYNWALDNGIQPGCHIVLDARPWNVRFLDRTSKDCRYLIASQCDPSLFDALEGHDVHIWHGSGAEERPILERYYKGRYVTVGGGPTVGMCGIHLLYTLGWRWVAVYGLDSCIKPDRHHAYTQPENDAECVNVLRVGRRKFVAHPWMSVQADQLLQMLPSIPDDLQMQFRGDNMITYIVEYTAKHGRPPNITIVKEGTL